MKKLLLIICLSIAVLSCSKSDNVSTPPMQQISSSSPSVVSVSWASIYEAGDPHAKFSVKLNIPDPSAVKLLNLRCVNSNSICGTVNNPKTETYILYDHVGIYPTYTSQVYYQFEFEMTSGNKIQLDKFQVY